MADFYNSAFVERMAQKYKLTLDGWGFDVQKLTQLAIETPWTKVENAGLVNLKEEDGDDEVHVRSFHASVNPIVALMRGNGTKASPTIVTTGQILGQYQWGGQLSTTPNDTVVTAELRAVAAANWTVGAGAAGTWAQLGGAGTGWTITGWVRDSVEIGGNIYVGTSGESTGLGNVYVWNGASWTKIGGGGTNSSWADQEFYGVMSLATDGTDLYAAIGDQTPSTTGAEVWHYSVSGGSWTKIGDHSFGFPTGAFYSAQTLAYEGGVLYAGLHDSGAHDGALISYDGTAGNWTAIIDDPGADLPGSLSFQSAICSIAVIGTTMYIGTRCNGGTTHGSRVFSATIGTWVWTEIGGNGTNSSWTNTGVAQVDVSVQNGTLYALFKPNTGQTTLWEWSGSAWTQIAGGGVNSSWNSSQDAAAVREDGGLASDTAYLYALISADNSSSGTGVWRRLLTGGSWEHIAGDSNNSSWENDDITSGGKLRVFSGVLYAGIGASGDSAEFWFSAVATPDQSTYVELYVTEPGETDITRSQKWFETLDVGIGGADVDGIYYDHSARAVGILTTTPARSFHVAGDDGMRLDPSAEPSSLAAGDLWIDSGDNYDLKWRSDSETRPVVSGPASAVDGDLAVFDGTSGTKIASEAVSDVVASAGAYTALQEYGAGDPPDFVLDPGDGDALIYVWEDI